MVWGTHTGVGTSTWDTIKVTFPTAFSRTPYFVSVKRLRCPAGDFTSTNITASLSVVAHNFQCTSVNSTSMLVGARYSVMYHVIGN